MRSYLSPWARWRDVFALDRRSLALFRFMLGIVCFGDVLDRCFSLRAHYTDEGVLTRADVVQHDASKYSFYIHGVNGTPLFQGFMMILHGFFALCVAIGWHTRLMTFLLYLWTISIQTHAPFVGIAGDVLCRIVMFFGIFLPLGEVWSVDNALKLGFKKTVSTHKPLGLSSNSIFSAASIGFIAQVMLMYMISCYHKSGVEWYQLYTASFWALRLKAFVTPIGELLAMFPDFLRFMTWAVLQWEFYGPLLFISPIFSQPLRMFGCLGFLVLHSSFGLALKLGFFTFITNVTIMALLPSMFWEILLPYLKSPVRAQARVFCSTSSYFASIVSHALCHFLLTAETSYSLFTHVDIERERQKDIEDGNANSYAEERYNFNTWLVVEDKLSHQKLINARALVFAMYQLSPLTKIFGWLLLRLPAGVTVALEKTFLIMHQASVAPITKKPKKTAKLVESNVYRETAIALFNKANIVGRVFVQVFLVWIIISIIGWNLGNIGVRTNVPPQSMHWLVWTTRVDQHWSMFSPRPPKRSWWYVVPAELVDGTQVELWRNGGITHETWVPDFGPTDWSEPDVQYSFYSHRWFKHMENGFNSNREHPKLGLARFICREFNSRYDGESQLAKLEIWIAFAEAREDGTYKDGGRRSLFAHSCEHRKIM